MKNFKKCVSGLSLIFVVSSCELFYQRGPAGWPLLESRPAIGVKNFPPTDTDYGKGFRDGCGTAWDSVTKGLTSDIAPKGLDTQRMTKSADYRLGFFDGFEQCTYVVDWDVV